MSALDQLLCFSMYSASRSATQEYHRLLAPWKLTYPQYLVLVVLWERGPVSMRELGAALMLDSGTLSPLVRRLESAGLVTRGRSADDERRVDVGLTDRGAQLEEELSDIPRQVGACMGLDQDSYRQLLDGLHALNASLRTGAGHSLGAQGSGRGSKAHSE